MGTRGKSHFCRLRHITVVFCLGHGCLPLGSIEGQFMQRRFMARYLPAFRGAAQELRGVGIQD
jgi:hypothetical protein